MTDQERLEAIDQNVMSLAVALSSLSALVGEIGTVVRWIVLRQSAQSEALPGEQPIAPRSERVN